MMEYFIRHEETVLSNGIVTSQSVSQEISLTPKLTSIQLRFSFVTVKTFFPFKLTSTVLLVFVFRHFALQVNSDW